MADITIDTNDPQYRQLLAGLANLRNALAPRITFLRQLSREKQLQWVQRDPLLRRVILLARELGDLIHEELSE